MRYPLAGLLVLLALLNAPVEVQAGLYYSGESVAELPSQWRGFLLDQRTLRGIAVRPSDTTPASPARTRYQEEADRLARKRQLSADEAADLGALYLRLGETARALAVLRPAQRDNPTHFHLAANLGTAWQLQGDLAQAAACLQQAVRLAPGKLQKAEELHLKLVRLRARQPRDTQDLDNLFGIHHGGPAGKYEPGRLSDADRKALPADAVALVQQLALWLPADARLQWQLGELAAAGGDLSAAASLLDGCVIEMGLRSPDLRAHRQAIRAAADAQAAAAPGKAAHEGHAGLLKPRSTRPLLRKIDQAALPPIDPKGVNVLPWSVVTETTVDRHYRPTFARYLRELDGKQVSLSGFMQPLGEDQELSAFLLIEYPVGCWYCEQPEVTAIVLVELPAGQTREYTRNLVRITGRLTLNATDPENFLYIIRQARVADAD
jgi:tetratricopeptide (TPR) repeat protein